MLLQSVLTSIIHKTKLQRMLVSSLASLWCVLSIRWIEEPLLMGWIIKLVRNKTQKYLNIPSVIDWLTLLNSTYIGPYTYREITTSNNHNLIRNVTNKLNKNYN